MLIPENGDDIAVVAGVEPGGRAKTAAALMLLVLPNPVAWELMAPLKIAAGDAVLGMDGDGGWCAPNADACEVGINSGDSPVFFRGEVFAAGAAAAVVVAAVVVAAVVVAGFVVPSANPDKTPVKKRGETPGVR
jgi:hypothetical protein